MNDVLENAIIVIALTLIVIIPVVLINISSAKRRRKRGFDKFAEVCTAQRLKISEPDYFGMKLIGADTEKRVLVFINNYLAEPAVDVVDLSDFSRCSILKKSNGQDVAELGLEFEGQNGKSQRILFYKQYKDKESFLKVYTQKAEEWQRKLAM
ncbi:hypothetical protein [Arcticibacter sp. MXS-1]|uniref:hypothetical protein n=1 Tax=Arcticibacter sp. MXS-1 TaxID=3341726 RepID=UPI0035A884C4